jgi:hypothetical protein|tara:strand:+ start:1332 stop:2276 length:945 start_codon:yes stop_codon:yes gene_type:complete
MTWTKTPIFLFMLMLVLACRPREKPIALPFHVDYNAYGLDFSADFYATASGSTGPTDIFEASGGVAVSGMPHGLWTINDSGDSSNIYLINALTGKTLLRMALSGLSSVDWEDMAHHTDSTGQRWLVVADMGDNNAIRSSVQLYAFHEPMWSGLDTTGGWTNHVPLGLKTWDFVYPGGARDAEALFVDPLTGQPCIITKREARNELHMLPAVPSSGLDSTTLIGSFPFSSSTAADCASIAGHGMPIIVKSYQHIWLWERSDDMSVVEAMIQTPVRLPYTQESQGEALWWTLDGGYATLSESPMGMPAQVLVHDRK